MGKHFVLFQHGLFGNGSDFRNFDVHFREDSQIQVIILLASANLARTLDGVNKGGQRCAYEISELIYSGRIHVGSKLSVIGHSLGGLYLRSALRVLETPLSLDSNETIWSKYNISREYAIFIATPHCGIHSSSWLVHRSSQFFFRHVSETVRDLLLKNSELLDLCDSQGISALNGFAKGTILYGNVVGDHTVPLASALVLLPGLRLGNDTDAHGSVMTVSHFDIQQGGVSYITDSLTVDRQSGHPHALTEQSIIEKLNSGLYKLQRYTVRAPSKSGLAGVFIRISNHAHTQIICHGVLDKAKVGWPMVEHIEQLLRNS